MLIDITKMYITSNKWNLTTRPASDTKVISDWLVGSCSDSDHLDV